MSRSAALFASGLYCSIYCSVTSSFSVLVMVKSDRQFEALSGMTEAALCLLTGSAPGLICYLLRPAESVGVGRLFSDFGRMASSIYGFSS